ncbi:CsbD family protein [Ancylobacter sp.]|uniref:CsbD family protein n=1 Tax=Ancylobacter sp. TaxID=1872567 RepID=UPI003BA8DE0B
MGSTMDKAKGMGNEAIGNVKQGVGKVTGSERLQAEGKVQELKGEAQQAKGEIKESVKKAGNL